MSFIWVPKARRKCTKFPICSWIGYDADKCPHCGNATTEAAAFNPNTDAYWKTARAPRRSKYFTVGIDLHDGH